MLNTLEKIKIIKKMSNMEYKISLSGKYVTIKFVSERW